MNERSFFIRRFEMNLPSVVMIDGEGEIPNGDVERSYFTVFFALSKQPNGIS